jgi:CRP-like cAMP-binding protein
MTAPSLKSLPSFDVLTTAEAAVFEQAFKESAYRAGEAVKPDGLVLFVREGSLRLSIEARGGTLAVATAQSGDLLGEVDFFEPEPVPILAEAASDAFCYAADRRALKAAFRYGRTGAAKFMIVCARGLSRKLRSANELLDQRLAAGSGTGGSEFRPAQLEPADLQRLKSLSVSRSYPQGAVVFKEGESGAELYVIGAGEVEILKESSAGEVSLARLTTGDFFGEMSFVDQRPRSATAVARAPLEVSVVPAGALERVIEFNVGTALYLSNVICKILARRLTATLRRISAR